eukprot:c15090_g2_i1 orf=25-1050(-)
MAWSSLYLFLLSLAAVPQNRSLNPPAGNSPFLKLIGSGVQVYRCEENTDDLGYQLIFAEADLFNPDTGGITAGYHYFLPRPDGRGGKPTWSLLPTPGKSGSTSPSSTATFKVIATVPSKHQKLNIANLLLRATSHSGDGPLSQASYVQRLHSIGGVPPSCCCELGEAVKIPYQSEYIFWTQNNSALPSLPAQLGAPSGNILLVSYFAEGFQIYKFNGSSWAIQNVSATLSSLPGSSVLGRHYFAREKDVNGGQPSWEIYEPKSRVTARTLQMAPVDSTSIPWLLNKATSWAGGKCMLGSVSYVQRLYTSGGTPPSSMVGAKVGDMHRSEYTGIYVFYVPQQ